MNHNRRCKLVALVVGVLSAFASPARADLVVLDFPDVNPSNDNFAFISGSYENQGFKLSSSGGGFDTYGTGAANFYAGEKSLAALISSDIVLTRTDGAAFSLLSIDLARNFAFDPAPTVTFTGSLAGGGTVVESFTVTTPLGTAAFQTFDFTGFTDLTQVSWNQPTLAEGLHQFTDVTLAVVPEPSGLMLGGIATIGGMLLLRRRTGHSCGRG